jgi:serine protease Do
LAVAQVIIRSFTPPYFDARNEPNIEKFKENEEPKIFRTQNFDKDIKSLASKRFIAIGHSSFNSAYEDKFKLKSFAKELGATLVLLNTEYTRTQTAVIPMYMPNSSTSFHLGTIYSGGATGSYSGTSTSYGSTMIPMVTSQQRYDQTTFYFFKSTRKVRFWISANNLSDTQRKSISRSNGAIINYVIEDTPAFDANIMSDDIAIKYNSIDIRNGEYFVELMNGKEDSIKEVLLTVIRDGKQITIPIKFK